MNVPVQFRFVKKNKAVYLIKDLPIGFGNRQIIPKNTKGYVTSEGFVLGQLHVLFSLYIGDEHVHFNELSAGNFLECDPYT